MVQDIGRFLQGVENPVIRRDGPRRVYWDLPGCPRTHGPGDRAIPNLKNELLGQVKRLYIVHASSSKSGGPAYMLSQDTGPWKRRPGFCIEMPLESCSADALGTRDLSSWIMAKTLIDRLKSQEPEDSASWRHRLKRLESQYSGAGTLHEAFSQLKFVSFGTWDTGRWKLYNQEVFDEYMDNLRDASDDSDSAHRSSNHDVKSLEADINRKRKACPQIAMNAVLRSIFFGTRSLTTCHDADALIEPDFMSRRDDGFMVVHNARISPRHYRKTRIYITTIELQACLIDATEGFVRDLLMGSLYFRYNTQMRPEFRLTSPPLHHVIQFDLEICLLPENEGNQGQLNLGKDVRDALEKYQKASKGKDGERMKILVGDDIPPCPCCGGRR